MASVSVKPTPSPAKMQTPALWFEQEGLKQGTFHWTETASRGYFSHSAIDSKLSQRRAAVRIHRR